MQDLRNYIFCDENAKPKDKDDMRAGVYAGS